MKKWDKEEIQIRSALIIFLLIAFVPTIWLFGNGHNFLALCWLALMVALITYELWFPIVFILVICVYTCIQMAWEKRKEACYDGHND
jgi:hypothetical protein